MGGKEKTGGRDSSIRFGFGRSFQAGTIGVGFSSTSHHIVFGSAGSPPKAWQRLPKGRSWNGSIGRLECAVAGSVVGLSFCSTFASSNFT